MITRGNTNLTFHLNLQHIKSMQLVSSPLRFSLMLIARDRSEILLDQYMTIESDIDLYQYARADYWKFQVLQVQLHVNGLIELSSSLPLGLFEDCPSGT